MIKVMTINDYEELFELWQNTANMGLRSLDDSKEGIYCFLKRNPNTNFVVYEVRYYADMMAEGAIFIIRLYCLIIEGEVSLQV